MGKLKDKLKKAFKAVAKVALVVIAIVQPQLIPAIGNAVLSTVGVTGASAAVATATGAAAINTASALVNGASVEDALRAGAAAAVSVGVSAGVGAEFGKVAGSAAGSAAGTIVSGGSAEDVLRNAIAGATASTVDSYSESRAVGAGVGAAIATKGDLVAAASAAAAGAFSDYKSGTGLFAPTETAAAPAAETAVEPPRLLAAADTGAISDVPTPGQESMASALGVTNRPPAEMTITGQRPGAEKYLPSLFTGAISDRPTRDFGEMEITAKRPSRASEPYAQFTGVGGVPEEMVITGQRETSPEMTITGQRPTTESSDATEREGSLAKQTPTDSGRTYIYRGVSATGGAPRTSALAGALKTEMASPVSTTGLTAYRPAGEIESEESGKRRRDVWNEASLRLKDALGL